MKQFLPALCVLVISTHCFAGPAPQSETGFSLLVSEDAWLPDARTLSKALDHEASLRILPVLGTGSIQALQDLTQFPNLDAALVTSDSLAYVKAQNLLGTEQQSFSFISAVKPLPVLLITKRNIANITALAGKRIATGPADSAGFATGELLLGAMEVPFMRVPLSQEAAIDALATGKADAALVLGTPQNINRLQQADYHFLPIVLPPELTAIYSKATLTSRDAPSLLADNKKIETVATELILAVNDASASPEQQNRLKQFEAQVFKQDEKATHLSVRTEVQGWARQAQAKTLLTSLGLDATIQPTGAQP